MCKSQVVAVIVCLRISFLMCITLRIPLKISPNPSRLDLVGSDHLDKALQADAFVVSAAVPRALAKMGSKKRKGTPKTRFPGTTHH